MQGKELALSPGVALKIHASADGLSPIPDLWLDTRKGRKRQEHVVCLSVTPFSVGPLKKRLKEKA